MTRHNIDRSSTPPLSESDRHDLPLKADDFEDQLEEALEETFPASDPVSSLDTRMPF